VKKQGMEGIFPNIIKTVYNKPIANIILNGGKLKLFPLKIKNERRISTLSTLNIVLEFLDKAVR
jgi:hypothetical protein